MVTDVAKNYINKQTQTEETSALAACGQLFLQKHSQKLNQQTDRDFFFGRRCGQLPYCNPTIPPTKLTTTQFTTTHKKGDSNFFMAFSCGTA